MAILKGTIINGNLSVVGYGTAYGWYTSSDERLKENVEDLALDYTNIVENIELKEFNYINDDNKTLNIGCIAQQLDSILPEKYHDAMINETDYLAVNESKLCYILLGALKNEMEERKKLEKRIEELEKK